ncbi:MAG TPA: cytidylate kinase-like family protein [Solirubrobacteraceae bacterium]|nr:cytidylate kinase-like family protein [Solirubrobacteraceae bacterium]
MTRLIALSAAYGAGGSIIGPALAERLGVPFLDRAIPLAVADRLEVSFDDAAAHDEKVGGGWLERVLTAFAASDTGVPTPLPSGDALSPDDFRRATEEVLATQVATGEGVILGRGAVVLLREHPGALRVRLDGPADCRARQAAVVQNLSGETADRACAQFDRTHEAYFRQFYGVQIQDPALYHVVLDSTAIEFDACVEIIARAAACVAHEAAGPSANGPPA